MINLSLTSDIGGELDISSYGKPVDKALLISHSERMDQPIDFAAVRNKLGMTQTELAERLGVAQGDLSNWERGRHKPSKLARRALEAALNELLTQENAA
jgi:DNA-binding transcriptional regulator YiaG